MKSVSIPSWRAFRFWLWIVAAAAVVLTVCGVRADEPKPSAQNAAPASAANSSPAAAVGYDEAIEPYVGFLKKQKQLPVEYILGLFKQNEIVVLCERFHAETTQYDMIHELASDPRFQQQSGHIFTEVGAAALRPYIESFLMDDQLSDQQVTEKLRYIARHLDWVTVWEKTNYYDFLRNIYYLNRSLPKERRMHVYPSDLAFDWENTTKKVSWDEFAKTQLSRRDQLMAENIIAKFNEIRRAGSRNKALVIVNARHAFPHLKRENGKDGKYITGFLMEAYPEKLANVMINSVAQKHGSTDDRTAFTAVQKGKWDAAFAVLGNPNVGFDFKGSPLGEDGFDYQAGYSPNLRYQDVFVGFVFFKPLAAHRMSVGLPGGLVDQSFADELLRRDRIQGTGEGMTREGIEKEYGTLRTFGYERYYRSDYAKRIQWWQTQSHGADKTPEADEAGNEKYEKMTPLEAARAFFEACGKEDWNEAEKFYSYVDEDLKKALGGLKIVSLGEPFQTKTYAGGKGWFVPYELKLQSGEVEKRNLAMRRDNSSNWYMVDGGLP